jgi:signal transduction histidine kinase
MIVDPGGRILAHTDRARIGMYLTDPLSQSVLSAQWAARLIDTDQNTIYAVAPIEVDKHLLGWAMLGLDTTATNVHLAYVTRAGIAYTFGAIIIGTIFAVFLAKSILRQLSLVLKGADKLAHNVLDEPIPIIRKDEVGIVAIALNNAAGAIRESRHQVETEMQERKKAEQDIRQLSHRLIHTIEDERKRIAQDLHDELGQVLTAVQFNLKRLENTVPENLLDVKEQCRNLALTVETMGDSIDTIASDLRPAILDHLGLIAAVKSHLGEMKKRAPHTYFMFQAVGFKKRLEPEIELVCYRIIQESLTNVLKHANASRVDILLTMSYPKLILVVKDNGRGFDYENSVTNEPTELKGIGLLGMKERAKAVGGTFEIRRQKPAGSITRVELLVSSSVIL